MKKFLVITLLSLMIGCTGCSDPQVVISVENTQDLHNTVFGISALIEIGDGLYYDSTTRIVYWWNGYLDKFDYMEYSTTPSPYYAPNGFPYKYNPEKNMFEEIDEINYD